MKSHTYSSNFNRKSFLIIHSNHPPIQSLLVFTIYERVEVLKINSQENLFENNSIYCIDTNNIFIFTGLNLLRIKGGF
ncbi:MAG: hypothetical protein DRN12_04985 [Thermoplasmata archaeon]|nr:MAG: hypothetical protein DRN12_04985 [Thermoplasmata archaeon]